MGLALVAVFRDDAGEVEVLRLQRESEFFASLAHCAGEGGFAASGFEFAATGAPEAEVGFLGAFEQEGMAFGIEGVKQGGDLVGQRHRASEAVGGAASKAACAALVARTVWPA